MTQVDESYNGREATLRAGEKLQVSLPQKTGSTGYRWIIPADVKEKLAPTLHQLEESVEAPAGPPGHGGIQTFAFEAGRPGAVDLEIQYRRSWETDKPSARTFRLHVIVEPISNR